MNSIQNHAEDILSRHISGFHQYRLSERIQLSYVSQNLCEMTGYAETELLKNGEDGYACLVHPADYAAYSDFLSRLQEKEQTATCEYRLIRKDGSILWVKDMSTSKCMEDGTRISDSVLTDITSLKSENQNLQFLNETIPCGFLKYSCEKQPKVTYINQRMIDMFRFPEVKDGELDYFEMYKSNIFLMIPMEERRRFSKYLNRVYSAEMPIAGEMTLLRCDGTRARVFGWVIKCINERGEEEFQSVCMDITERHQLRKKTESKKYMKALADVYDKIFEFNLDANMVKCLHCEDASFFKGIVDVPMRIEEAVEKWLIGAVDTEETQRVRSFFQSFCQKKLYEPDAKPPQITYHARSSDGTVRAYSGVFIKIDDSTSLYCCRRIQDNGETELLRMENDHLRKNMENLVMRFSDGIAAFEVSTEGLVKPLYASENVCEFFGYTQEEWIPLTQKYSPLENFVAYSEATYEDFIELLRSGEAEFTYFDYKSESEKRIKAICTQKEANGLVPRYVMLYSIEDSAPEINKILPENRKVSIRTFGYFDVFIGDKPIAFRNKKSKELLALLVDRRGGYISSEEAIGFLWEDEPANSVTMSRYRKVALRLKNTLEEYGVSHIVETVDGKRRIATENVTCDLYDYLSGKEECAQLFKGSYLTNYSWAETTLGELNGQAE